MKEKYWGYRWCLHLVIFNVVTLLLIHQSLICNYCHNINFRVWNSSVALVITDPLQSGISHQSVAVWEVVWWYQVKIILIITSTRYCKCYSNGPILVFMRCRRSLKFNHQRLWLTTYNKNCISFIELLCLTITVPFSHLSMVDSWPLWCRHQVC